MVSIYNASSTVATNVKIKALITESNSHKAQANKLFASTRYSEAIGIYDQALASLPNYLDFEIAVLQSNISACHLKLEDWKAAVESATKSLDSLEKLLQKAERKEQRKKSNATGKGDSSQDRSDEEEEDVDETGDGVVEILGDDESASKQLQALQMSDSRRRRSKNSCKSSDEEGKREGGAGWMGKFSGG